MANRYFTNQQFALEKSVVSLFARVTFGATGAPTLVVSQSKGISSITRVSAGKYTIVLGAGVSLDTYPKLLMARHVFDESGNGGTAPAAPSMFVAANATATANVASLTVTFNTAGTATDPASGEAVLLELTLGNSTAL
jgi:hypothetical protein